MSEENNWKVYKAELHETMSKGTCVPFLGQFLTQIMQQETAKEVMSYRRKSQGRRPQSSDPSADNRETLSAPTTPLSSIHDNMHIMLETVSPNDLPLNCDEQQTPTFSKTQPELIEEVKNKEDELKYGVSEKEEAIKTESSCTSIIERRDTLSPLPIGKFKYNHLPPTNVYKESFKKSLLSSDLLRPNNITGQQNGGDKIIENGDIVGNNFVCKVVKALRLESYDGASSSNSCDLIPPRDVQNVLNSKAEDMFYNNDILDISQVELNTDDTLDTPVSDFDKETSPDIIPTTSTPTEDIITVFTDINTVNEVNETPTNTESDVKKSTKERKKKRSFRRKSPPPEEISQGANNYADDTLHKKERWNKFRRKLPPLESTNQIDNNCSDDAPRKKEKWKIFRRNSAPPEEISQSAYNCFDDAPRKKEKWKMFRRKSAPSEEISQSAYNCSDDAPQNKETSKLRQILSSPLSDISSSGCDGNNVQKKEKGIFRWKSSPARKTSPSCSDDDAPRKKEKHSLRRKLSSPLRGYSNPECNNDTPQRREKLHIYKHSDVDGFDAHNMLQEIQFSSMRYMNSLTPRPDIQSFIKGLNYNTEEENYQISIKIEPIEQCNY